MPTYKVSLSFNIKEPSEEQARQAFWELAWAVEPELDVLAVEVVEVVDAQI